MEHDLVQDVLEKINACLLVHPSFDFSKIVELSSDINQEENKSYLSDIIAVTFLNHLGMKDAASVISGGNLAVQGAYSALKLDTEESQKAFIRFITVMNPSLLSSVSRTIMNIMSGVMFENTRLHDSERLTNLKASIDKLAKSGKLEQRSEALIKDKPASEKQRLTHRTKTGISGWLSGVPSDNRKHRRRNSFQSDKTSSSGDKLTSKALSKVKSSSGQVGHISEMFSAIEMEPDEIIPEDSISVASKNSSDTKKTKKREFVRPKPGKGKTSKKDENITRPDRFKENSVILEEDSIVSL